MDWEPIEERDEELAHRVIGAAIEVHRRLGRGFLESVYEKAMIYELTSADLVVETQKDILVPYRDIQIAGQRLDLLVGGRIILELKAVRSFDPIHEAQLIGRAVSPVSPAELVVIVVPDNGRAKRRIGVTACRDAFGLESRFYRQLKGAPIRASSGAKLDAYCAHTVHTVHGLAGAKYAQYVHSMWLRAWDS